MWPDLDEALVCEPIDLARGIGRALFVSPHFAEAVVFCADLLAANPGSRVVSVLDSAPSLTPAHVPVDRRLAGGTDIRAPQEDDLLALFLLDADPVWLDIQASRYRPTALAGLVEALGEQIGRHATDSIVFPLGLRRDDDRLVAEACLELCLTSPERTWIAYAEASARGLAQSLAARERELQPRGFGLDPLEPLPAGAHKRHAVACYSDRSAAHGASSEPLAEARFESERYWQVRRNA